VKIIVFTSDKIAQNPDFSSDDIAFFSPSKGDSGPKSTMAAGSGVNWQRGRNTPPLWYYPPIFLEKQQIRAVWRDT
jgi:hypothetical protein